MTENTDKPVTNSTRWPLFLMVFLLGCFSASLSSTSLAACSDIAAPGVNWSGCDKNGINLENQDLSGAILTGIKLKDANLTGARLVNAELNFSDVSGAIFDSIIHA